MKEPKVKLIKKGESQKVGKSKVSFSTAPKVAVKEPQREFPFSDEDFAVLSDLIHSKTGIVLADHKKNMVYSRLSRRLRALGLDSFTQYLHFLSGAKGTAEIGALINAITTNLTSFFRESHHFDHLEKVVFPQMAEEIKAGKRNRIRIWSAGCSSGDEPYSIAMVLHQFLARHKFDAVDAKILATDLDTNMLRRGRGRLYAQKALEGIPGRYKGYFTEVKGRNGQLEVSPILRKLISFKQLNLMSEWPMSGPFDVIFCRNVMIYFDNETKESLAHRMSDLLSARAWLYIGHSETLSARAHQLKLHGRTIYQKTELVRNGGQND